MSDRTPAERLDHALDALLADAAPSPADPALRPLLVTAGRVRAAVAPVPAAERFERRLERRFSHGRYRSRMAIWRHLPAWFLLSGAISSAIVGVGMTAYALWRGNRRSALHRVTGR